MDFQNIIKARQAITDKHGSIKPQQTITNFMDCPVCETGTLNYKISCYNGHIAAQCTSPNCVQWME